MGIAIAFISATLFGLGLGISGMTDPANVIGFLDVFGDWRPALLFTMGGAVLVHSISYQIITRRASPILNVQFQDPKKREIDRNLIVGSTIFGLGWGLGGYCPGPAIASLVSGNMTGMIFVFSMLAGMAVFKLSE